MTPPVLPAGSLGGLEGASTAGMGHTAQRRNPNRVRQPNGEYTESPTWGPDVCCHISRIGSDNAEMAAARGFQAQWQLKVSQDVAIAAGEVWRIRETACQEWGELVRITGELVKHGRLFRLVAAVDTTLNQA